MVGTQDVYPGDVQAHHAGCTDGGHALFRGDLDQAGAAAAMQGGAELASLGLALHRRDHLVADHEAANVGATGFLDVFLDHDVLLEAEEGLDHRLGRLVRFGQYHAHALGAFQHLDHQRCTANHLDQVGNVVRGVGEAGHRQADALARQQLQSAQLVARATDGHRLVERVDAHHLELAQHRAAIEGHRGADARNHRIEAFQRLAAKVDLRLVTGDVHVGAKGVDHLHLMAPLLTGLHQAAGGIQTRVARQHGDLHWAPGRDEESEGLSCT